ncbi:MAG: hypothetical protein D6699_03460 [Aquificota bacterium]|nr:MAG: hypothetical protein D6699_03460 [Aquificota bacterium]
MKVLIVLYSKLLQDKDLKTKLLQKVGALKKLIGPDSLYAVITSEMKEVIDLLPDLVFIRNDKGSFVYGLYKGLRKLRGNDVLVLDGGKNLEVEKLREFISKRRKNVVYAVENMWKGMALIRLIDLDYLIRTLETFLKEEEANFLSIVEKLKEDYGIEYEICGGFEPWKT